MCVVDWHIVHLNRLRLLYAPKEKEASSTSYRWLDDNVLDMASKLQHENRRRMLSFRVLL